MRQQKRRGPRRLARAVLAVGVAVVLAGCGAGQITQTDTQKPAVNGTGGAVGALSISNAALAFPEGADKYYPAGSDVPLLLTVANRGEQDDELLSVESPAMARAAITGDKKIIARRALQVLAEAGATATRSPSPTADSDSETDSGEIGTARIVLKGLKQDLRPGQTIDVTLTFRDAGRITLRVPIAAPSHARTAEPHGEAEGH